MADTHKLIAESLDSIQEAYLEDTDSTLRQIESIRQLNTATTLKYIKKEEDLKTISRKVEKVQSINHEINTLIGQLDSIEARVEFISELTKELDDFTKQW